YTHAEKLVRIGLNKMVVRGWLALRRFPCNPAKRFKFGSASVPKDRHEGQDEICLIESLALAINANKHLCDLFFRDCLRELQSSERVHREVIHSCEGILDLPLLSLGDRSSLG